MEPVEVLAQFIESLGVGLADARYEAERLVLRLADKGLEIAPIDPPDEFKAREHGNEADERRYRRGGRER